MKQWLQFRDVTLRTASVNLIGSVFPDSKEGAAAVRINIGGADSKFLERLKPSETMHHAMDRLHDQVEALRDACGAKPDLSE